MPQLILQFTEKGQGWRGSNVRTIWGGLQDYRTRINDRIGPNGTDSYALEVLKNTASTQDEIAVALRNSSPEFQKQATLVNNNIAAQEAYNKSVLDSAHPLSALASNLVGVGKAFVSMSVQFGIVWPLSTQENYDKLIGANKAYGAAVTTIGGVTTIDSDKLNASNL